MTDVKSDAAKQIEDVRGWSLVAIVYTTKFYLAVVISSCREICGAYLIAKSWRDQMAGK